MNPFDSPIEVWLVHKNTFRFVFMKIVSLEEIKNCLRLAKDLDDLIESQKSAFIDFSDGLYDVPPPMQYLFPDFKSDSHIKGGYRKGNENFVLKIANNSPAGNEGLILVFETKTGKTKAILEDQGYLTTLRTAIAGLIIAQQAPWKPRKIGIVGSGPLASQLHTVCGLKFPNSERRLYARNAASGQVITKNICSTLEDLVATCDVILTCTSSSVPLIHSFSGLDHQLIIGLGSDCKSKQELSQNIFAAADLVIVDSFEQSMTLGDVASYLKSKPSSLEKVRELGAVLKNDVKEKPSRIVADLSGIGCQDVSINEFILDKLL